MKAAIFYATREGQTRRIAMRIADDLIAHGIKVDVFDVATDRTVDWSKYFSACVAASVHTGKHEREIVAFVKDNRAELERLGASFVSVSLSEATVEDPHRSQAERDAAVKDVQQMIGVFVKQTAWTPARTLPVAGALTYSKYNFFVRFLMKRIARKSGAPTDTSRDHEFTRWANVDRFARELADARIPALTR